jgi:hypothetical protein
MDSYFLSRMLAMECREDAVTEVFASLLELPPLRDAFIHRVLGAPEIDGSDLRVERQYENRNARGIPDVVLHSKNVFLMIENKLGALLTDNQPCEYLKEVLHWKVGAPEGHGYLIVQMPAKRLATLTLECQARLAGLAAEDLARVPVRYITWEMTAAAFREVRLDAPAAAFVRDNFSKLVEEVASRTSAPLTKEHVMNLNDAKVLGAVSALQNLMSDLKKRAERDGDFGVKMCWDFSDVSIEVWPSGDKGRSLYIVCSFDAGVRLRGGPLWAQLSGAAFKDVAVKAKLVAMGIHLHPRMPDWVDGDVAALELQPDVDPPVQCERIWEKVVAIVNAAAPVAVGAGPVA